MKKDLALLLDYLESDEKHHYEECSPAMRKNHIYKTIIRLQRWLKKS